MPRQRGHGGAAARGLSRGLGGEGGVRCGLSDVVAGREQRLLSSDEVQVAGMGRGRTGDLPPWYRCLAAACHSQRRRSAVASIPPIICAVLGMCCRC